MVLVTGAMASVIVKLGKLLNHEYKMQKGVRKKIMSLSEELESMHAALRKVAEVPPDQLDEQIKLWARHVRELSYDVEDILDTFLVRVEGCDEAPDPNRFTRAAKKISRLFKKSKARRQIAGMIKNINEQAEEVAQQHRKYRSNDIVAKPVAASAVDPRLEAMYKEVTQLVGIDKSRGELISMLLSQEGNGSNEKMKIVSVVGVGGLGKTTLAKAVYDKLKPHFSCGAFVPVARNPGLKKVFRDILIDLDKEKYMDVKYNILDERQLVDELRDFLRTKRYIIVIDDVWEMQSWERIKLALVENNCGSCIITTTRNCEVATKGAEVYKLQPLPYDNSKKLFYTRIFGGEDKCLDNHLPGLHEVAEKVLKKCGGIPLAIITMASLLVGKSREQWFELCNSIGFRDKGTKQVDDTMWILSLSYYDLPSHLRTCLLYLSAFPEDCVIDKDPLIWKWIAEGFVQEKQGVNLFEDGEGYFNDLINRSMIQAVNSKVYGTIDGCRVHDMVLDLLRSLSHEVNFVTISDNAQSTILPNCVRRLARQNGTMERTHKDSLMDQPRVRSFISFGCVIDKWVSLPTFKLLRVLALEHCRSIGRCCYDLKHIGNLLHLRYLGIQDTSIHELPEEVGALKFLQILIVPEELPSSVGMLTQLVCLRAWRVRGPDGIIGKLTSLEELQIDPRDNDESKRQFVKDLGNLRELRVLRTRIEEIDERMVADLVQSLGRLHKIHHLTLQGFCKLSSDIDQIWDVAVLPRHLRHLLLGRVGCFDTLPSCIDPSRLPSLAHLDIIVANMDEQGLEILGGLTELRYLKLRTYSTARLANAATDGCFQKLRSCELPKSMVHLLVNEDSSVSFTNWNGEDGMAFGSKKEECIVAPDVMPNLQELKFNVNVKNLMQNNSSCNNLGLEYLPSLQKVIAYFADDVDKEEAALRHAIEAHPNRPTLQIKFMYKEFIKRRSKQEDQKEEGEATS